MADPADTGTEVRLTSLVIAELADIKIKDQAFKKARDRLKKQYTLKKLGELQRKYITRKSNPQKFKEEFEKYGNQFLEDYEQFRQTYIDLFIDIHRVVTAAGQDLTMSLRSHKDLVTEIETLWNANPEQFFFDKESLKKFKNEYKKAIAALADQLQVEYVEFTAAMRGKRKKTGLLSKWIPTQRAARMGRKKAEELKGKLDTMQDVLQQIQAEINGKAIRQDFIMLLLQHIISMEGTDDSLKEIKKDIVIIMDNVNDDQRDVITSISRFLVVMHADPVIGPKLKEARRKFHEEQRKVLDFLGEAVNWPKFEKSIAQDLTREEGRLIAMLTQSNERHINAEAQKIVNEEVIAPSAVTST